MKFPLRLLQSLVVFLSGVFALFVFAGNLMDYDSNFQFVKHVLSMDTTFEGNALMWRAIDVTWIHHVAYIGIILAEGAFAALGIVGGILLFLRRNDAARFNRAKIWGSPPTDSASSSGTSASSSSAPSGSPCGSPRRGMAKTRR